MRDKALGVRAEAAYQLSWEDFSIVTTAGGTVQYNSGDLHGAPSPSVMVPCTCVQVVYTPKARAHDQSLSGSL